jgi:phage repressor protein C with HTH and peptisase S24 domain
MAFSERVKARREALRLSQEELARKVGVTRGTIQRYEAGDIPKGDNMILIAEALDCSVDWLLSGKNPPTSGSTSGAEGASEAGTPWEKAKVVSINGKNFDSTTQPQEENEISTGSDQEENEHFVFLPLFEAELSAGDGSFIASDLSSVRLAFRRQWLRHKATSLNNLVLLTVRGTSMEDILWDGDTVLVDCGRKSIHSGGLFAIGMGELIYIKKLELLVGGRVMVISENRDEYPPYEVDQAELRIIGQVIWFARELV